MPRRSPKGSSVSPDDQNRVLLPARRPQHLNATDHFFLDNHRSATITCTRTASVHLHGPPNRGVRWNTFWSNRGRTSMLMVFSTSRSMLASRKAKRSCPMKIHTMPFRVLATSAALAFYLGVSLPASAQVDSGGIRGTVKDQSGAVVSGAKVTLTNEDTSLVTETITSDDGNYSFVPVKISTYTLAVEFQGFQKATQRHIQVEVQQQVKADFILVPGSVSQSVEVTAVAPLLQTQDASVANLATSAQINSLPLNGRNYTFLAQLGPGVTSLSATRGLDQSGSFVANGLTTVHNNYILDGIDNNSDVVDFLNGAAYVNLPPPDAIQEFKVQTSNFSAEFGRAGGAVVNATVKSGTNRIHGTLWEFLRNDKFDAADEYFANPKIAKGELRRNQFGGAIGGPILKNKN